MITRRNLRFQYFVIHDREDRSLEEIHGKCTGPLAEIRAGHDSLGETQATKILLFGRGEQDMIHSQKPKLPRSGVF